MNLHAGIDEFLLNCEIEDMSKHTITWYRSLLGRFADSIHQTTLEEISAHDIRAYLAIIHKTYSSESTISAHTRALHRFWKWSALEHSINNPMRNIKYPKPPKPTNRAATLEDIAAMFRIAGPRERAIIAWLLDTGCRAGGTVNLKIGDIYFDERKAIVTEKRNKTRTVVFTSYTKQLLEEWISYRGELGQSHVFYSLMTYKPLTPNGLYQVMRTLARNAKVTGRFSPHSFRHAFGQGYVRAGGDLATLSMIMGHDRIDTTVKSYLIFTDKEIAAKHEQYSPVKMLIEDYSNKGESG